MNTGNPVFSRGDFGVYARGEKMTLQGTINKSFYLLGICLFAAIWVWTRHQADPRPEAVLPYILVGTFGGFVVALITIFKAQLSAYTSPVYAALEGLAIGGVSALFEAEHPGIVINAIGLTFGVTITLLFAYKTRLIRVTETFRLVIVAATGGIALLYIAAIFLRYFGGVELAFIHEGGVPGIIFSLIVVAVAALNLVLDFDFIEEGATQGSPKYMEWYAAFGLLVTLVWLYLELLRLLSKKN
jgi:uncharacterized YccA/Bax inhibitor family protein